MKPIALKGHERPITKVKCNREGDLLFSSSKDYKTSVWYTENGERLGTYNGHKGVVWTFDITWDSRLLCTGSGDNFCIVSDIETGKDLRKVQNPIPVRTTGFSYSGNLMFYSTDDRMNYNCELNIFDVRDHDMEPLRKIPVPRSKITAAVWSQLDREIITGHDDGEICQYDIRFDSHEPTNFVKEHKRGIQDLQMSPDQTMVVSASKDNTAKLFDAFNLEHVKTYKSERPVNGASICPNKDVILLGGGEEAMTVTQTDARQGKFEAKFYHLIFEEEFARVKGHFGTLNSVAFYPDGSGYCSGGEDSYVRLHKFDQDFFDFDFDC